VGKIWQLIGGGSLAVGAPSHGTTGTMDNPAVLVGLTSAIVWKL